MASHTEENYLKSLFTLTTQKEGVNASELSSMLGVSLPTINSMVNKLKKQGLVNYLKYKPISLTEKGRKQAALVLRKHRLTEMYLFDKMGFGWDEVHDIAEQVEHIASTAFFDRMDELLGFPKIDPHGSPIPDKNGDIINESNEKLSNCNPCEVVRLVALAQTSSSFLKFLDSKDLTLGTEIEIKSIENFDNSMTVSYLNHSTEIFSQIVCENLLVKSLK